MKRLLFPALAGLALVAACADQPTTPLAPEIGGPSFGAGNATTIIVSDVAGGVTANDMAGVLGGPGVTIQNVTYTGAAAAGGTYTNGAATVGFDGVVLSSGSAINARGPNASNTANTPFGTPGDPDLNPIAGVPTFDAASLSFELIPNADTLYFQYVLGSDEHPEFSNGPFADGFGLFVNGTNCALVGSPPVPVTVKTINATHNPSLFRVNTRVGGTSPINLEPDGLTVTLTCVAPVNPNVVNTIKLAVADGADPFVDTWAFIKAGSFSTTNPANAAPELDSIAALQSIVEASTLNFTASATDADSGQALTFSVVGAPAGASIDSVTGVFAWTPVDDDPSGTAFDDYTFTVRVTDDAGASDEQTVTVRVFNDDPGSLAITGPTGPIGLSGGSATAHISVSFADAGTADPHVIDADCGNSTTAGSNLAPGVLSGAVDCTYTAAGVYTVFVNVSDDDAGFDSDIFQYVVVYDPGAGFVTGGGWITSPAGAYAADPTLTGKANFGFNAKYHRGATVPDGQTQFQFKAAGFNFHSTAYEWLVVAGARAQYKGTGTINGSGSYNFILTVIDGQRPGGGGVDRFRLKVWGPGGVIYDNQVGDPDDGPASTALGGGSIVIHPN